MCLKATKIAIFINFVCDFQNMIQSAPHMIRGCIIQNARAWMRTPKSGFLQTKWLRFADLVCRVGAFSLNLLCVNKKSAD